MGSVCYLGVCLIGRFCICGPVGYLDADLRGVVEVDFGDSGINTTVEWIGS